MKKIVVVVVAALVSWVSLVVPANAMSMSNRMFTNKKAVELRMAMRELWEEHIVMTRNYIISALADMEDTATVAGRLLKNQDDIGNAIIPYYGEAAGNQLSKLLRDHIMIAVDVVKAAKSGNNDDLASAQAKWKSNGTDIAMFLAGANKNWDLQELKDMLDKHLSLTTDEVVARLKKDWPADIKAWDAGQDHMLMFADILTNGIVMQFPNKF